ncbi:hypothetical protein D3C77_491480 [compost metagenome]
MSGTSSIPIISGTLKPYISASINPTRCPLRASATAKLTVTVDFPTPPLPLAIAMNFTPDFGSRIGNPSRPAACPFCSTSSSEGSCAPCPSVMSCEPITSSRSRSEASRNLICTWLTPAANRRSRISCSNNFCVSSFFSKHTTVRDTRSSFTIISRIHCSSIKLRSSVGSAIGRNAASICSLDNNDSTSTSHHIVLLNLEYIYYITSLPALNCPVFPFPRNYI